MRGSNTLSRRAPDALAAGFDHWNARSVHALTPKPPIAEPPAPSIREPSYVAETLVRISVRHPWAVVLVSLLVAAIGLYVTATRFAITTDTDQLIYSDSAWSRDKGEYEEAFPHAAKAIVAVVDGITPEKADEAAARLAAALEREPGPSIGRVWRPDGGPYFDRYGLMLLPVDQVREATDGLVKQSELLLALSGDPSLRGFMRLLALGAERGGLDANGSTLDRVSDVIERVLDGKPASLSWQTLTSGKPAEPRELRRFVLAEPVLDYKALEPAAAATARIREVARGLGLTAENGVTVRLTGAAPVADEEFSTVREGAPLHLGLSIVAIAAVLYLALKSGRVIFAVLLTTFVGLVVTIGAGLLMVGRFNVISVAVAALFLGLGVDFGIQVAVRYRDERHRIDDVAAALKFGAKAVGWSLTLAALSLLAGFFSFLPTNFKGVSELGLITGVGMIIAFVASLTLLPALIALTRPKGEPDTVELPALAAVDHWILRHRRLVIGASVLLVLAGLPFLFRLEFDANPMHLRSAETEGVATFLDLTRTEGETPNTISLLEPSLEAAKAMAERVAKLPEVDRVLTVADLIPTDQPAKLALIKKAADELGALLDDEPPAPAPSDSELVAQLRATATALAPKAGAAPNGSRVRLAGDLTRLADAPESVRTRAAGALVGGLPSLFAKLRLLLTAGPVTLADMPATLKADWIAPDGRARVEVVPKGDANDNAVLERFVDAVRTVAPNVTGPPVDIVEAGHVVAQSFMIAGLLALGAIFILLTVALRRPRDVALTLGPLIIATILTLETAYLIGMPLNLANIIALPLMLAVGVNFHIYYMIAWRDGVADMLASSLTRAIFFSSLVTGIAFGSLWLSDHPGTASMGKLLTISLVYTLLAAFVVVPAFLGPPRTPEGAKEAGLATDTGP